MVKTKFNKTFFGTELPIIQAPMAGVQDSALTIAVPPTASDLDP